MQPVRLSLLWKHIRRGMHSSRGTDAAGPKFMLVYMLFEQRCQISRKFRRSSRYRPSVFARYSTIAFTSPSDACAPRATMFCTIAFHSFAFIRWLVTTSTE